MAARGASEGTLETRVKALEAQVRALEDREKIRECLARNRFAADLGLSEYYAATYTEDGVSDLGPGQRAQGREELLYHITNPKGHKRIENRSLHTVVNLFIRVNGDTAWAEGYDVVYVREGEGYIPYTCGYLHWEFEKHGERWYIALRYRRPVGGDEWGGKVINAYQKA